ncbi:hypothetical protein ABIA52_000036 [Paenarthrobacter histidinolovorans]|uniref:Uncharacterized protein n=1 Tax=Paenarthrobacter histidinolovorans TaxID=43664 RepID=A0ABW8MZH5_9MICC
MPMNSIRRQRGRNAPRYDPLSGATYRPDPRFAPHIADKLVRASNAADINISSLLSILVDRMVLDANGLPDWYEEVMKQEALPIEKAG